MLEVRTESSDVVTERVDITSVRADKFNDQGVEGDTWIVLRSISQGASSPTLLDTEDTHSEITSRRERALQWHARLQVPGPRAPCVAARW